MINKFYKHKEKQIYIYLETENWCIDYTWELPYGTPFNWDINDFTELNQMETELLLTKTNLKIQKFYHDKMLRDINKYCKIGEEDE